MLESINNAYIQCNNLVETINEIQHELETPDQLQKYQTTSKGIMIQPDSDKDALQNLFKQSEVERIKNTLLLLTGQIMQFERK